MRKLFLLLLCFGLFCGTAQAEDERYVIEAKVDVTDDNASVAREKAMNKAIRAAITAVAKRISTEAGVEKISNMTDDQLINFVRETSVSEEKTSDVRYMANLRVVVNEELLQEYMREREIPVQVKNETSVVVIPLFREFSTDAPLLWEGNNLWKKAWDEASDLDGDGVRLIPVRDSVATTEALTAQQAEMMDTAALEKVMRLYGATDAYVLDAVYDGVEGLEVKASSWSGVRRVFKIEGAKSSGDVLFNQAVSEIVQGLQNSVAKNAPEVLSSHEEITVLYPFSVLGDWITAEQKIKEIPIVLELQVQAMAQGRAQFQLLYSGSRDVLERSLGAKGYELEDNGEYVILKNIGE